MNIDAGHLQPDGTYKADDGCVYDDAQAFIHSGILGFCGCGRPQDNLRYLRAVLRHIENAKKLDKHRLNSDAWRAALKDWRAVGSLLMGQAEWFTLYVLAKMDLTEHGGSAGASWLTDTGAKLLEDLETMKLEDEEESAG